jgi:hypothetical protein
MAKASIQQFSTTATSNTDIDGINVNTGWPPSNVGPAFRELMAQLAAFAVPQSVALTSTSQTLTVEQASALFLSLTGTPGGAVTLTIPAQVAGGYVQNNASDGSAVTLTTGSGGTISIANGGSAQYLCDGTNVSFARPPGVNFGALQHFAVNIESGGWRRCAGQTRPQTDPFWVWIVENDLQSSWGPGYTGSSTYNMPDSRGFVLASLDNLGGTAAGRLTTAVAGFNTETLLAGGGNEYMQSHTHGASAADSGHGHGDSGHGHSDAGHGHTFNAVANYVAEGAFPGGINGNSTEWVVNNGYANIETGYANITTGYANVGVTVGSTGGGSSQNVQPTLMTAVMMYVGA